MISFSSLCRASKYGEIRMGHGPPEFRDITWFAMILSCSVGTGVFIYGLQEPLDYYTHSNKYRVATALKLLRKKGERPDTI